MKGTHMQMSQICSFLVLMEMLFLCPPQASAATGELWETRSAMESDAYGRMDMGSQRECRSVTWREKPQFEAPGKKGECTSQQVQRRGDGYAWKFDCGSTKGEASARLMGSDLMEGEMHMSSPQGRFTLKFSSRKIGSCDTSVRGQK